MGRLITPAIVEVYLCDPTGVRIDCLDYVIEYEYGHVSNSPGPVRLRLPHKFNRKKIKLDNIIEIWRGHGPGTLKLDYCGFLRAWRFGDDEGAHYTELFGLSSLELLQRRVVANYDGSAQAGMTDYTDDMMKAVAIDQLGADAGTGRDLTSVGGGFTVQSDQSDGPSRIMKFSYRNVLELAQEINDAGARTTPIYFDIVPIISSSGVGTIAFQFRTFANQRGNDRTQDSFIPIFVGTHWGNLQNGSLEYDHFDEVNYVYILGPGDGADRAVAPVSDTTRLGSSIWNRREGMQNSSAKTSAGATDEGRAYLNKHKPRFRFGGDVIETPAFRYGRDWGFGDRVTVDYAGVQMDAMIDKVHISRGSDGQENITARLEVEE